MYCIREFLFSFKFEGKCSISIMFLTFNYTMISGKTFIDCRTGSFLDFSEMNSEVPEKFKVFAVLWKNLWKLLATFSSFEMIFSKWNSFLRFDFVLKNKSILFQKLFNISCLVKIMVFQISYGYYLLRKLTQMFSQ